jgi:hypothetical protein
MKKQLFFLILSLNLAAKENKFVFECGGCGAFFSQFMATLGNLRYCEQNNKIPVVYWNKFNYYYQPEGYNGSTDGWEYYFEPLSSLKYEPGDQIHHSYVNPSGFFLPFRVGPEAYSQKYKDICYPLIKKYIKIKPNIQQKIDLFYEKNMKGKKNIGIHLRGTDKIIEATPIDPNIILNKALEISAQLKGECNFFIATDDERLLNIAKAKLAKNVIHYNSHISKTSFPVWIEYSHCKALLGEEILIESQLLSKCDYFIHTTSNVSIVVGFFNPNLKSFYFY